MNKKDYIFPFEEEVKRNEINFLKTLISKPLRIQNRSFFLQNIERLQKSLLHRGKHLGQFQAQIQAGWRIDQV